MVKKVKLKKKTIKHSNLIHKLLSDILTKKRKKKVLGRVKNEWQGNACYVIDEIPG